MIQQRPVAILRRLQPAEQVREQTDVVPVQDGEPILVLADVGVVGQDVEGIPHAALRIDGVAQLFREQQRGHPGDVGLPGEHLQVEHQLDVVFDILWSSSRGIRQRQVG